jgi:TolB-like protein/Flp pilus assembly protein TadD
LDYLAEGLAESITNNLSQLSSLRVASHSSAIRYKNREIDASSVARELKVQAVLHGRVTKRGQDLAISLWLVDAKTNRQLWGEQYLRQVSDIVRLQSEISREVSEKLRLRLTGDEEQRVTRRPTINPEAYRLYLLARFYSNKYTEEGDLKSIDYFNQAVTKDPTYAAAYAGLATSHVFLASNSRPPKEEIILARGYAAKALELDESLDEGHYSKAAIRLFYDWDWVAAESEIKRTLELNSNHAGAYSLRGHLLRALGRPVEAVEAYKRAWEFDPLSLPANYSLGLAYYFSDQYDRAIDQYQKTSELIPGTASVYGAMALAYVQKGEFEKAIRLSEQAWNLSKGETTELGTLGQIYAAAGKRGEALRVLQDLVQPPQLKYVRPSEVATIYALLGRKEDAFMWLEKAFEERSPYLLMLKVDPTIKSLRSDPRFDNLLRRMKLP